MAEFTSQQRAALTSAARHNLVNAISKTGKTQLLIRLYLDWQEQPGEFKAIFLTSNGFSTQRITDQLHRITKQDWTGQLIGTFSEIGHKLVQKYYADLNYRRVPKVVPDIAVAEDRQAARLVASKLIGDTPSDQTRQTFIDQWNQEFVSRLHQKDVASPRSLLIDAANLFAKLAHHSLANVHHLAADDVHDFSTEEMMALLPLQERMEKSYISGNTNVAINDRYQDLDIDNWINLINREDFTAHPLSACFNIGSSHGWFLHQLAAFNSKKLFDISPTFAGDPNIPALFEVLVPSVEYMVDVIHEMERQLQLGIRNRVMGVVMRTRDEARAMARTLGKPCCILWDKTRLYSRFDLPTKGIVVTTPYDAPFLNLDFVTLPNCMRGYWPHHDVRSAEGCRHLFLRAVSSARLGTTFLIPDPSNGLLVSQFVSEGCNPQVVTKAARFEPAGSTG